MKTSVATSARVQCRRAAISRIIKCDCRQKFRAGAGRRGEDVSTAQNQTIAAANELICELAVVRRTRTRRIKSMDENRVAGTAKNLGGKVEEGFGRVTGDAKTQAKGLYNQAEGTVQDLYGQAVDSAGEAAQAVKRTAVTVEDTLRNTIETKPYTAVAIALGLGWLIGRVHRPF
jgi:uncharacterized protein YjbJ (UPF0337 family)